MARRQRLKVCAEAGCPELTTMTRCHAHTREREHARGTRQQRGYDLGYDKQRKRDARVVASGQAICWSCGGRISPLQPWHEGHCEDDRNVIHGPEHPACNLGHIGATCPHPSHR